jgi:uncharacterized protein
MNNKPASEDRIWAIAAHLSALAFGVGIFLPVLGWSSQRRKSNYASFQSLQALGYQSLVYTVWILLTLVIIIVQSIGIFSKLITAAESGANFEMLTTMAMGGQFIVTLGLIGLYVALPIIAAIACAFGKDFRYPIMGNRLARYLGYDPVTLNGEQTWLIEEHEDRWVAALAHFSVIIIMWGLLTPVTVWMLQGKRSLFLKFQAVQAFVFQIGTLLLYFVAGALYVGGMLFFVLSVGVSGTPSLDSSAGMAGAVVFLVSMLCILGIVLVVPLLHIMGQWAGYRVLKGEEYRYPLVGKMVEKRLMK